MKPKNKANRLDIKECDGCTSGYFSNLFLSLLGADFAVSKLESLTCGERDRPHVPDHADVEQHTRGSPAEGRTGEKWILSPRELPGSEVQHDFSVGPRSSKLALWRMAKCR